jgi:hypothetical protein
MRALFLLLICASLFGDELPDSTTIRNFSGMMSNRPYNDMLQVMHINGMNTRPRAIVDQARHLNSELNHVPCHYLGHPTQGVGKDLVRCIAERHFAHESSTVDDLTNSIVDKFFNLSSNGRLVLIPWSEGVMITDKSLNRLPQWMRDRIEVIAFGGPVVIKSGKAASVTNILARGDRVARLGIQHYRSRANKNDYDVRIIDGNKHRWINGPYDSLRKQLLNKIEERYLPKDRARDIVSMTVESNLMGENYRLVADVFVHRWPESAVYAVEASGMLSGFPDTVEAYLRNPEQWTGRAPHSMEFRADIQDVIPAGSNIQITKVERRKEGGEIYYDVIAIADGYSHCWSKLDISHLFLITYSDSDPEIRPNPKYLREVSIQD